MSTTATLRKNGQQSSCEPCRTSKLRCDHTLPVCQRCVARQRADQCIYHPCPLTKPRDNRQRKEQTRFKRRTTPADSDKLYEWTSKAPSVAARSGPNQSPHNESDEPFPSSGFLGLTSHSSDFFEHLKHFGCQSLDDVNVAPVDPRDVEVGAQILALLEHIPFFVEVIELRFAIFEGTLYGPPIIREILTRLKALYQETVRGSSGNGRHARLVEWSKTIFDNTATVIETHAAMTMPEYVAIVAPRWEIVGLIIAMAGRATYQISQTEAVLKRADMPGKDKHAFRKIAMAVNDVCLQFSNKLGILSDPLVWATCHHTIFLADMHGPTDHRTWKMNGEIASLIYAIGLHQGKPDERAPFFLAELRTRTMAAAYATDKEISVFLGRPPQICRRYCNLQLPLDLSWEDIVADAAVREAAMQRLGPDGWDTQEHTESESSKFRVILLAFILREMILEVSLSYNIDDLDNMVKKIRQETNELRSSLPASLQWSPENKTLHPSAASLHLEFLYQDLLLSQTVAKRTGETPDSLLDTSREILSVLLDVLSKKIRIGRVDYLVCCDLCYIGLPAAGVLSKELLRHSHALANTNPTQAQPQTQIQPPDKPFPRSEIIQHLSIFAAHLETFFTDREGDYDTRARGLRFIRSVLDVVLSPAPNTGIAQVEKTGGELSGTVLSGLEYDNAPSFSHEVGQGPGPGPGQEMDFAALWEEIDFDWEGDRRVLFS